MTILKRYDLSREKEKREGLQAVHRVLKEGGVMLFPTDTVYGIGSDALNQEAVRRVFEAKSRPEGKSFLVLIQDESMLRRLCSPLTSWQRHCCRRLWPGPVTLLLPARSELPGGIVQDEKIAVRWPAGELIGEILRSAGCPVVAPSANRSGEQAPTTLDMACRALGSYVDLALDGGTSASLSPSTLVDVREGSLHVIRPGVLPEEEILQAVGKGAGTG